MEIKSLTEGERITMKCVWEIGDGARLSRVLALAKEKYGKNWKSQTVSTFLGKLVAKNFIEQYREGRYCCYHIKIDQRTYRCKELVKSIRFWENDNIKAFAEILMDDRTFLPKQREQLLRAMK